MYRVLVTDNLSDAGLQILKDNPEIELDVRSGLTPDEVREALHDADGIIIRSGTKLVPELLEGQGRLKAVVRAGVGVDNIDLPEATRQGIVVMNTPAGNTISTAEHSIAMMMALSRNIAPADASMHSGKWERKKFTGAQVAGKTLAVVGLGRVGLAVAKRANGLEMKVRGYDPFISEDRAKEAGIELFRDIDELISKCDYVSVHTPLTDETRDLINSERLAKMPKGVRIINCARGGIVNEADIAEAVKSGHVAGAALDVFTSEPLEDSTLADTPGILLTPHLGASTDEAQELVAVEAAETMVGFLTRNEVRHAVNMAPVSASEMQGIKKYIDLAYRLGLLLGQMTEGEGIKNAQIHYRGDVASRPRKLMSSAFTCGLLSLALGERINIVNAGMLAKERSVDISELTSTGAGDFTTLISVEVQTDQQKFVASGTMFGNEYLRLVRLNEFQLDAYLDGEMLIYRHLDVPGLIGAIGTTCGNHNLNISHMALGREGFEPGGKAVAVLNLDSAPSKEALAEIEGHKDVTGVDLVSLPTAGFALPWLGL